MAPNLVYLPFFIYFTNLYIVSMCGCVGVHVSALQEREGEYVRGSCSCRLVFGATQMWVFQNPLDKKAAKMANQDITFEYAQEEIAAKSGVDMSSKGDAGKLGCTSFYAFLLSFFYSHFLLFWDFIHSMFVAFYSLYFSKMLHYIF